MATLTPLSVAFIWHMHQPMYKDTLSGEYLMPWARLHAVKDYLDMVKILTYYPNIRQTFNLVPSLIDQLQDYADGVAVDRLMALSLQSELSLEDRHFILERGFDAQAQMMIGQSPYYHDLLDRRNRLLGSSDPDVTVFSDQTYFDILALFNLVWIDPMFRNTDPALQSLWEKQKDYTLADRQQILSIQRTLIQDILPTYKLAQEQGQIEVTTTPYYHPILPLLLDTESAHRAMPSATLPKPAFQHAADAVWQVQAAYTQYQNLFGIPPKGVWPAEQSISPEALRLLKQQGFEWAVSSEGNLSRSLGIPFEKDPFGNIVNVQHLCQPYRFEGLTLLFRELTLSDLIGFQYGRLPAQQAVHDFIQRLKQIQSRCTQAHVPYPIVTIALDGENCWETYPNDGHDFLNELYQQLSADPSLDVCRVGDYLEKIPDSAVRPLEHLHSGSWINSDFHIWIGDPVKNAAWQHLKRTRDDLEYIASRGNYPSEVIQQAWRELYIAEGSDWFWWYGEPHNSGQDHLFDTQFRGHLANIYHLLGKPVPEHLDVPMAVSMGHPLVWPKKPITPRISGQVETLSDWDHAGCLDWIHGAMHRASDPVQKIYFGSDDTQFYFRIDLNHEGLTAFHEIVLYVCLPGKTRHNAPMRLKTILPGTTVSQRYLYAYEIHLSQINTQSPVVTCAEALPDFLWLERSDIKRTVAAQAMLDLALPFENFNTWTGEALQFVVCIAQQGTLLEVRPETFLLSLARHAPISGVKNPQMVLSRQSQEVPMSP